ncbi:uncharacterized protein LOC142345412 [Convolutriloba macropyga]|uniref:uncharacterized protein LOC142345412 n=1 Tax=Convolutriloba macropyga TaxID=536237 RepID=UPI003F527A5E
MPDNSLPVLDRGSNSPKSPALGGGVGGAGSDHHLSEVMRLNNPPPPPTEKTAAAAAVTLYRPKDVSKKSLEYIPEDLLAVLRKPEPFTKEQLKTKITGGRVDSVWFHDEVAKKYDHLIRHPPCTCGVGPKLVTFTKE